MTIIAKELHYLCHLSDFYLRVRGDGGYGLNGSEGLSLGLRRRECDQQTRPVRRMRRPLEVPDEVEPGEEPTPCTVGANDYLPLRAAGNAIRLPVSPRPNPGRISC